MGFDCALATNHAGTMSDSVEARENPHGIVRRPRRAWLRSLRGYLLLPHLVPVIIVELATVGFAVIAWNGIPPLGLLSRLLLAMLGGQLAIGAINDIVDFPDDSIGKPQKPLPSGAVSMSGARGMVAVGLGLIVFFGLSLGPVSFGLLALGTGAGIAYDLWLKRSSWSWLPYFIALPLLPIWVFVTLGRPDTRMLLLYPMGALAAIGVHLAQALPDVAVDRTAGMRTPTSRLGSRVTFALAWFATGTAPLLAIGVSQWMQMSDSVPAMTVAFGVVALFVASNVVLFIGSRRLGERLCFPLVATSLLTSGLLWTLSIAR
jgi:4-hydroxybenzoate polyprenyltransferase